MSIPGSLLHAACSLLRDFSMSHFQVFVATQLPKLVALKLPAFAVFTRNRGRAGSFVA